MMMATGCIQSKQCNANTCPTGVATQNKRLQHGLIVDDKQYRIANYHKNTIKSFLEIVGAMGLTNPSQLQPAFIMRRTRAECVKPFNEIHTYLEPGQLLGKNIPDDFKKYWHLANLSKF